MHIFMLDSFSLYISHNIKEMLCEQRTDFEQCFIDVTSNHLIDGLGNTFIHW